MADSVTPEWPVSHACPHLLNWLMTSELTACTPNLHDICTQSPFQVRTAVTLLEWLSKLRTGCGLLELTSNRRICGLPAAARSCLSAVISSLLTCATRRKCASGIASDTAARAVVKHRRSPSRRWQRNPLDRGHVRYRLELRQLQLYCKATVV